MRYFVILLLFTSSIQGQFKIPETPKIQTSLYDYANVLNSLEAEEIKACKTLQVVADIVDPNFMG